jgi:Uma2 family endonuclease
MTVLILPTDAPAVAGPPQGHWTHEQWETLPDDGNRYEVIDGVLYMSTAPSTFHQWIILRLVELVGTPAMKQSFAIPFFAPIGVLMPGCDAVQPDFGLVRTANQRIIRDRRIRGVPDLLAEVLSPNNRAYDEQVKLEAYARAGLPEYVIVDPQARALQHYRIGSDGRYDDPLIHGGEDSLCFDCLPLIEFKVSTLFAGAPDTTL